VDSKSLPQDTAVFQQQLLASLSKWKELGKKGIWLKIPIHLSHLISTATLVGFTFHHAQQDYLMLTTWLPETSPNTLPKYASHYVGVGGFVVNDKNEVLVVTEKNGPIRHFWKIPGGMIEPGEEICDAATREVLEETGIKTEFVSLLCFRQHNNMRFGLSDLYFVCRLRPLNLDIKIQQEEIDECKWMPMEEFCNLNQLKGLYQRIIELENENAQGRYSGFQVESLPLVFMRGSNLLYHGAALSPKL